MVHKIRPPAGVTTAGRLRRARIGLGPGWHDRAYDGYQDQCDHRAGGQR
jgi:hypothetical protein